MEQDFATLETSCRDGVLSLTLNRPDKLNAWTYRMGAELRAAILAANDDPEIVALVVTGAGRAFCAGADIAEVFDAQSKSEVPYKAEAQTGDWVGLLRRSKPLVAALNGAAIGVGLTLALPMDQLIASESATLALRFVKLGLVPELASSHFVVSRCGFGAASDLILSGRTVSAAEAQKLRLVDQVVPADELRSTAHALARSMGDNPLAAVLESKRLLTLNGSESDLELVLSREFAALERSYASPEHREAIDAFLGKRAPDFRKARGT